MAALAIRRLSNRVSAPDLEEAWRAGQRLDQAARSLPGALDALLPAALEAAGVPQDAVMALRRLNVRVELTDEPDGLARAWAAAIAEALSTALADAVAAERAAVGRRAGARASTPVADADEAAADPEAVAAFPDIWAAEAELLRLRAEGAPTPWWADEVLEGPADPAAILSGWVERDAARAATALLRLAQRAPQLVSQLSPGLAARLTVRLLSLIQAAGPRGLDGDPTSGALARAIEGAAATLPDLPADRRSLFVLAALIVRAPALAVALAAAARGAEGRAVVLSQLATAPPKAPAAAPAPTVEAPDEETAAGLATMHGGLLLLLRPLAELGLVASVGAGELPAVLSGIGLVAMQRLSATLPPAARRRLLERERSLLAVFAGAAPPDDPLDVARPHAEAAAALDAVLAVAPSDVAWAAGAERRYFGGPSPFEAGSADDHLARLILRPARLTLTPWSADLTWPAADIALRRAGWDIDPGWLPWIGRVVRFHFDAAAEP